MLQKKKTISLTTVVYRSIMLCNDGKCKKVRNGEDRHTLHGNSKKKTMRPILSRELIFVITTAVGVMVESFLVYQYLELGFPDLKQMGNLEAVFVEIGIAIFLTVTVYLYSGKSERDRKMRLRKQIISSFEMLNMDFSWLATQKASKSINEELINKKNLRLFHIQNLIGMLPEKLGGSLSLEIPDFCEKALLVPRIVRPLDPTQLLSVDYTGCESMILDAKKIIQDLRNKWKVKI